jgi:hypothetical protein
MILRPRWARRVHGDDGRHALGRDVGVYGHGAAGRRVRLTELHGRSDRDRHRDRHDHHGHVHRLGYRPMCDTTNIDLSAKLF